MRILTLWQPWASLIAKGLKQYETRSWSTNYRGKLLIHAAKRPMSDKDGSLSTIALALHETNRLKPPETWYREIIRYPLGCIVAVCDLTDCRQMVDVSARQCSLNATQIDSSKQSPLEQAVGDWSEWRYAWKLENVMPLDVPIYCKGGQGLRFPPEVVAQQIDLLLSKGKIRCE